MRTEMLLAASVLLGSYGAADGQVRNDWTTQFTDTDSGAYSIASLVFYGSGEDVRHQVNGSQEDYYLLSWGSYSEAEAKLDNDNYSYCEAWGGGQSDNLHDWHTVSVQVGRRHRSVVDEPLGYAEAETYHDVMGVTTLRAEADGLAFCKMTVQPETALDRHEGPEPLICTGMVIKASMHGTHVTYRFNPGLWRWERSGEVFHYLNGSNVASPIQSETYPGFRGLDQQDFYWWVEVVETDLFEIFCEINGDWDMFNATVSQQSGSLTKSQDIFDIEAAVHKTIEALP